MDAAVQLGQEQTVAKGDGKTGELESVAARLDEEIRRFERLTETATRGPLGSEKSLDRAAVAIREAAASHERFGQQLHALIAAVATARDRQQASADRLNARAAEIERRRAQFASVRARFAAIGEDARAINEVVLSIGAGADVDLVSLLERLEAAEQRMGEILEETRGFAAHAREEGMTDIEREADTLRQQVGAARNKIRQLRELLVARASEGSA